MRHTQVTSGAVVAAIGWVLMEYAKMKPVALASFAALMNRPDDAGEISVSELLLPTDAYSLFFCVGAMVFVAGVYRVVNAAAEWVGLSRGELEEYEPTPKRQLPRASRGHYPKRTSR